MPTEIHGYAKAALDSLSPAQIEFIQKLPKAELHAHLNGSIPLHVLQSLAEEFISSSSSSTGAGTAKELSGVVKDGVEALKNGVVLNEIHDFFGLFPAIYALTDTPKALAKVTRAVLEDFLSETQPDVQGSRGCSYAQCTYLELRSIPKETTNMTRMEYVKAVLDEVERYPKDKAALIVGMDRKMDDRAMKECIDTAVALRKEGRRVVGIDLCGDPLAGDVDRLGSLIACAKEAGLGVTLHVSETPDNPREETLKLLSYLPDRIGHATFLDEEAKKFVLDHHIDIELCLSSNLLCKTVPTLGDHHITQYLQHNHPISICTDDTLVFRTSLLGEYALLLAKPPLGLGLSEDQVKKIAHMSLDGAFGLRDR